MSQNEKIQVQVIGDISIQDIRDTVLSKTDGHPEQTELEQLKCILENIAYLSFEDSEVYFETEEGTIIVRVDDFEPNDGMFCFDLMVEFPDGKLVNLNYDFNHYLSEQTFTVPGTDYTVKVNPILLKLYDELSYGRNHNILAQALPECVNWILKEPVNTYPTVRLAEESYQYAHLCEMCDKFEDAKTHEKFLLVLLEGKITVEFDAVDLCKDWSDGLYNYKIENLIVTITENAMSPEEALPLIKTGLKNLKYEDNHDLLDNIDWENAVFKWE